MEIFWNTVHDIMENYTDAEQKIDKLMRIIVLEFNKKFIFLL